MHLYYWNPQDFIFNEVLIVSIDSVEVFVN